VSLIKSLLTLDPMARPTAAQVLSTVKEMFEIEMDQGLLKNYDLQVIQRISSCTIHFQSY
jgi:hypothetical protein